MELYEIKIKRYNRYRSLIAEAIKESKDIEYKSSTLKSLFYVIKDMKTLQDTPFYNMLSMCHFAHPIIRNTMLDIINPAVTIVTHASGNSYYKLRFEGRELHYHIALALQTEFKKELITAYKQKENNK